MCKISGLILSPWAQNPKAHENPRVFSCISSPIFLESSIQCTWGVGLHQLQAFTTQRPKHNFASKESSSKVIVVGNALEEESNNDDSNDRDYELSMITIKIKRMWKSMNSSRFNYFSKRSFHKKEESPVICSKCKKPRHFKSECPDLEKSKDKKKKFFKSKKKTSWAPRRT